MPGIVILSALSLPVFAAGSDPIAWLKKMQDALRHQNYDGIFTYMRGSTFDTVRIVHIAEEGREMERLINLNGEVRELYRENDEILCYYPAGQGAMAEVSDHSIHIGPFSPVFTEKVLAAQDMYNVSMHGEGRIAGRPTVKLLVSPKFNDRYGYRLWLDEQTGLLLQSHLVDRGAVKEVFQFTNLELGTDVSQADLATRIPGESFSRQCALETNDSVEQPVFKVKWLPNGFRPIRIQGNRLHFSDGLAHFSVFVEQGDASALPEMTTTVGGTVVITRRMAQSGPQITVVGEVPIQTARKVADSVEPVLY